MRSGAGSSSTLLMVAALYFMWRLGIQATFKFGKFWSLFKGSKKGVIRMRSSAVTSLTAGFTHGWAWS